MVTDVCDGPSLQREVTLSAARGPMTTMTRGVAMGALGGTGEGRRTEVRTRTSDTPISPHSAASTIIVEFGQIYDADYYYYYYYY